MPRGRTSHKPLRAKQVQLLFQAAEGLHGRQGLGDARLRLAALVDRAEELAILKELAPHLIASKRKLWMLTLVTKQDLWWPKRNETMKHYHDGEYSDRIKTILGKRSRALFRHELAFASLVISNFTTGAGEKLTPNAAGYDQKLQVESLRRLFETIDGLRQWEVG